MLEKPKQRGLIEDSTLVLEDVPSDPLQPLLGCQIDTRKTILIKCRMWPDDQKSIIYIHSISIKEPTGESIGPG